MTIQPACNKYIIMIIHDVQTNNERNPNEAHASNSPYPSYVYRKKNNKSGYGPKRIKSQQRVRLRMILEYFM